MSYESEAEVLILQERRKDERRLSRLLNTVKVGSLAFLVGSLWYMLHLQGMV